MNPTIYFIIYIAALFNIQANTFEGPPVALRSQPIPSAELCNKSLPAATQQAHEIMAKKFPDRDFKEAAQCLTAEQAEEVMAIVRQAQEQSEGPARDDNGRGKI